MRFAGIATAAVFVIAIAIGGITTFNHPQAKTPLRRSGTWQAAVVVAAQPGRVAIDAYPWANVTSIRNVKSGVPVELDGPIMTPASPIDLPAGEYEIALSNPDFKDAVTRVVAISAGQDATLDVQFADPANADLPMLEGRPQLESAYRAFAAGNLDASESTLTAIVDASASSEALLLRGCALYTAAMLSRSPESGLAAARADFNAALRSNRALRLDNAAFSPKLIAFFEQVRRGG